MEKSTPAVAPIVGWSSLSVAAVLVVYRPDAAAVYIPLVFAGLIASIVSLAARRLAHGLAMLACVLLMPAIIVESATLARLARPVAPPNTEARRIEPSTSRSTRGESESVVGVSFVDHDERGLAAPSSASNCPERYARTGSDQSLSRANCKPGRD